MEQILYRYNPWWEPGWQLESLHQRAGYLEAMEASLDSRDIVMLTGLRRIGKTTLMHLLIDRAVIGFLIDGHAGNAGAKEPGVFFLFQGLHFEEEEFFT